MALHFSFTPLNALKIDQMVADIKEAMPTIERLKNEKSSKKDGSEL